MNNTQILIIILCIFILHYFYSMYADSSNSKSKTDSDSESNTDTDSSNSYSSSDTDSLFTSSNNYIENFEVNNPVTSIDGLVLWLDAKDSKTIELNESKVISWEDKSPLELNPIQLNHSAPLPIYNSTGLNNLPTVSFSTTKGNNGFVVPIPPNTFGSTTSPNTKTFIVFVVSQRVGPPSQYETIIGRTVRNIPAPFDMYNSTRVFGNQNMYTFVKSPYDQNSNTNLNINVFSIIGTTYTEYLNNSIILTQDVSQMMLNDDASLFGIGTRTDNVTGFNGNISEVIVYNSKLTPDQISSINNYLAVKWTSKPSSSPTFTPVAASAPSDYPVVPFVPVLSPSPSSAPEIVPVHPDIDQVKSCTRDIVTDFEYSIIGYINDKIKFLPKNMGTVANLNEAITIAKQKAATVFQLTSKNILYIGYYYNSNSNKIKNSKKDNSSELYAIIKPKLLSTPTVHPYKIFTNYSKIPKIPKNIDDFFLKEKSVGKVSTDEEARKLANKYGATAFWVDDDGDLYITYNFNALLFKQTNDQKSRKDPFNQIYYVSCLFNNKHRSIKDIEDNAD